MNRFLAVLQLVRIPNVFTAMADIFMGFLIAHGSLNPTREFVTLLIASSSIYLAGMVLNDWFDFEVDRQERPTRPLPSGRIARSHALAVGIGLLIAGLISAWVSGPISRNVALVLIAAVVAYDGWLKSTMLGPAVMGLCRALNVLLGMSTQPGSIWLFDSSQSAVWRLGTMAAAGIGLYIMGVTRFARREASGGVRSDLLSSTIGFNLGLFLLAMLSRLLVDNRPPMVGEGDPYWLAMNTAPGSIALPIRFATAAALWSAVVLVTNIMVWRAVIKESPAAIQQAVKTCIMALIGLDAAIVAFVVGPGWAVVILVLLIPSLTLGRWVYST